MNPTPVELVPTSVPLPLWQAAARQPDALALISGAARLRYHELASRADGALTQLHRLGVTQGDRIVLLAPTSIESVVLVHAAAAAGAILCPISTRLLPADIDVLIERVEPRLVIAGAGWLDDLVRTPARVLAIDEIRSWRPASEPIDVPASQPADTPQTIIFSSGTTDAPKGVLLSAGNHFASAQASAMRLGVQAADVWLATLPLYHIGGLSILTRSAVYGTAAMLVDHFDEQVVLDALCTGAVTQASLVPTMLARLVKAWTEGGRPPIHPRVRVLLIGGAASQPDLIREAREAGWPTVLTYGLTEAASQVATEYPPNRDPARSQSGRPDGSARTPAGSMDVPGFGDARLGLAPPLPSAEVRIVDNEGEPVVTGQLGEIWVRGPMVMLGYWQDPDATAEALAGGWLHTGDVGRLTADGLLEVVDRRTDLIISGGENISPREVEAVLGSHPGVVESCVVGMPDPAWGQVVVGVVVLRSDSSMDQEALEADLRSLVERRLASFKRPKRFVWVDSLPRTASGKLRRAEVRAWLSGTDPDVRPLRPLHREHQP